jgi:hypothetical protein
MIKTINPLDRNVKGVFPFNIPDPRDFWWYNRHMEAAKRKVDKEMEQIDAMAQDGKAGITATKEIMKEDEKKEEEKKAKNLQRLEDQSHRGTVKTYNELMAELLIKMLNLTEWPMGWKFYVAPTKEGVILEVHSPNKSIYRNAFKPTGEPKYDLNAIETYVIRAQNLVDRTTEVWTKQNAKKNSSSKSLN